MFDPRKERQMMRAINQTDETSRKIQALSNEELVYIGLICASIMTLLALIDLFRLSSIMG